MKHLLLATIFLGLIPSANATDTCNFVSEYYPDVVIEIENDEKKFGGFGIIKYKDEPMLDFATGLSNGYGGQYYVIRKLAKNIAYEDDKKSIASGKVVGMIGTQTRTTPLDKRKSGEKRIMFPNFGTGYYYSLSNYFEPEKDGRFAGRTKAMSSILGASEGFFIPDKICERFIFYGWD